MGDSSPVPVKPQRLKKKLCSFSTRGSFVLAIYKLRSHVKREFIP